MPPRLTPSMRSALFWLRHPLVARGYPAAYDPIDPAWQELLRHEFGGMLEDWPLDLARFEAFRAAALSAESNNSYRTYSTYAGPELLTQKLLEHFVSLELAAPAPGHTLIDVGSAQSPFAAYVAEAHACTTWSLDPAYKPGIVGRRIGAPGDAIPLDDASVDALTLHCAIDHFERDGDTLLLREAARVLTPGGRVIILPLYVAAVATNICDPAHFSPRQQFDAGAEVRAVANHRNRFGRHYSPATLRARLLDATPLLEARLVRITGDQPRIPNNYLHLALVLTRRAGDSA